MATTAYERYLKNKKEEDALEPVDVQVQDTKPLDLDEVKFKIQQVLTEQTEPKKPVKWLSMPSPKNILNLYYTLAPEKRLADSPLYVSQHTGSAVYCRVKGRAIDTALG